MSFTLALPRLSLSGEGAISETVAMLAQQGARNALILTDRIVARLEGAGILLDSLKSHGIAHMIFDEIEPNQTTITVEKSFAVYQRVLPDVIIAMGGGSVIDMAKSVRILSANPGSISQYEGVHHELMAGCRIVAINTMSGTAAEVTSNAVIIDLERRVKMVIISHSEDVPRNVEKCGAALLALSL